MAVVIRLAKTGKKGEGKFRIVVKEKRSKRDGKAIEILGWYEKGVTVVKKEINKDRLNYWTKQGAKLSQTVEKLLK